MGKRTRIILYALSLVTMLAMVTLIIFSHGRQSGEPAKRCAVRDGYQQHGGTGSDTGSGRARRDGSSRRQNGIQNDTEQEEVDIADDTTLILQGMYCLQTPLKATMMRAELKK